MKHSGIHTEQIPSQVTEHTVAFIEFQHVPVNLTAENCQPGLHVRATSTTLQRQLLRGGFLLHLAEDLQE